MRTRPHGSALLIAVITVLVVTVTAMGILRFAYRESVGARAAAHEQALVACAEAARLQLLAEFRALGFNPATLAPLNVSLSPTTVARGGHYDTPVEGVVIDQVTYLPEHAGGPTTSARDLTGISSLAHGERPVKVVVRCKDGVLGGGRELEVEFGIRFGL